MLRVTFAVFATVLMTAGCSSTVPGSAEPGGPTVDSKKFSSVQSILDEIDRGGATCEPYEESSDKPDLATEQGLCGIRPDQVVIAIYETKDDVRDQIDGLVKTLEDIDANYAVLYGPNWSANCDKVARCEKMQNAIGGKLKRKGE